MSDAQTVTFYLHPKLRRQAKAGHHNFIDKVGTVLANAGLRLAYDSDDHAARLRALSRPGYGMFFMDEPVNARDLTFRKTYLYPFWHIEKHGKRWAWPVARARFDPAEVDARKAANFHRFWRNRLLNDVSKDIRQDGFVLVPVQGRLTEHRSFQFCSPIDMIKAVLRYDPDRHIIVTLHPHEVYSLAEQQALETLLGQHERLHALEGGSERYLQNCDYVVTQNSSIGFRGYFFEKPLVLFGQIDFHHIALNVGEIGVQQAFAAVQDHAPDYAAYLHWFLQSHAINAGRPEASDRIRRVLRDHGWPV